MKKFKSKKIRILRIIHSLDPNFGGPQNAIIDHTYSLIKAGIKVDILTNGFNNFKKHKNINIFYMGNHYLGDFGFNLNLFIWLFKNKKNYDYFIIHGLWSFYTLIARILLAKKFFVFTHGQLDPFFSRNFKKKFKKKIYWYLIEKRNLLNSKSLLLTTNEEKKLLNRTYVNTDGIKKELVKYGISKKKINKRYAKNIFFKKFPKLKSQEFLLFLGRFHEKKGCEILIKSLKKLIKLKFRYHILLIGPESAEKNRLRLIAKKNGVNNYLHWSESIHGDLKWGAILNSKAMVLSSHGENFGVSLVESLSLSKPVITTNKVNIYKKILNYKAGFVSNNTVSDYSKILLNFNNLSNKKIQQMSFNSFKCFDENFNLSKKDRSFYNLIK